MKLFIGLGNIGKRYENTRHNIGFMFLDYLVQRHGLEQFRENKNFRGFLAAAHLQNEKVLLLKPSTYMNLSGEALAHVTHFYRLSAEDVCVFHDDIDLPFSHIRYKSGGGTGGHNGIKSLQKHIGSTDFSRIKFGVDSEIAKKMPTDHFVLSNFTKEEKQKLPSLFEDAESKIYHHLFS